jgi:UDP-GlcNAc:undecaprenyl-phosphate GlcNAc-1-phosphate transferase
VSPLVLTFALAFIAALAATPLVRRLAFLIGATDAPDARRVHQKLMPRAGGLGVAAAVVLAVALTGTLPAAVGWAVLAGAALLLATGIVDDVWSLPPRTKLLAQIAAAVLAVSGGLRFSFCAWATSGNVTGVEAHVIDVVLTVGWIVFVTNALNLTDGLDGLAAGIGITGAGWLAATALHLGDTGAAALPLAFVGALLGFLVFNFNPASIFLGDSGSLLIGYALAILPLAGQRGELMGPLGAFMLVALPATDTVLAMARRLLSRCLPEWGEGRFWHGLVDGIRNTVQPDRRHIHHRLLDLGFNQRRAVLLLYTAAVITGGLAYAAAGAPIWPVDVLALGLGLAVVALVQMLGIDELQIARTGLFIPVLHRMARHRWLVVSADLAVVVIVFAAANFLCGKPSTFVIGPKIFIVAAAQLVAFQVFGVYRTVWWNSSTADFAVLFRACAAATIVGYMALRLCGLATFGTVAVVRFLLMLPIVMLMRSSHVLLASAARRAPLGERALICGTTVEAQHALTHLRRNGMSAVEPIGFIEMQPRLQGRNLGRLPVVGTLDLLQTLLRERHVHHLVIADPSIRGAVLQWTRAVCRARGVDVHRYVERLRPLVLASGNENGDGHGNGHGNGNGNGDVEANGGGNGHAPAPATGGVVPTASPITRRSREV